MLHPYPPQQNNNTSTRRVGGAGLFWCIDKNSSTSIIPSKEGRASDSSSHIPYSYWDFSARLSMIYFKCTVFSHPFIQSFVHSLILSLVQSLNLSFIHPGTSSFTYQRAEAYRLQLVALKWEPRIWTQWCWNSWPARLHPKALRSQSMAVLNM